MDSEDKVCTKDVKENKRTFSTTVSQKCASRKKQRKGENPVRIPPPSKLPPDVQPNNLICKNSACKAFLTSDDAFCKRCSCCICHGFDDNKDPSLWLICTSESSEQDSCGLSCHIDCALQHQKVGVVDLGPLMQLDGSYCCASCGNVSGILEYWKKQIMIAKDARRMDVLYDRICLSYRILDGTSRYKDLHKIVRDIKDKLEIEVCPMKGVSAVMARSIVSRLSIAGEVQKLCSLAIEKADTSINTNSNANNPHHREDSYTETGNLDCFAKNVDIMYKNSNSTVAMDHKNEKSGVEGSSNTNRDGCFDASCSADASYRKQDQPQTGSHEFDINVTSVPDLNIVPTPLVECSRDEDNGCTLGQVVEVEDGITSLGMQKKEILRCNGSGDSQTLISGSTGLVDFDGSYESCVKIIRWLEREEHIEKEFREKFLTWYSFRSTAKEHKVVNTYIRTLIDDPRSLAGQLIDSFSEIISSKRPNNGWH